MRAIQKELGEDDAESAALDDLREAMARIARWDDARWRSAATSGAEIAARWSIDAAATAFVDACRAGAERGARRGAPIITG